MKTIKQMRAILTRAYRMDFDDKSDAFVEGFFTRSCASGVRLDAAGNIVDPDDLASRSARGETDARPGRKLQPGGAYEPDEDAEAAAMARARNRNATAWQTAPSKADDIRAGSLAAQRRSEEPSLSQRAQQQPGDEPAPALNRTQRGRSK